jgi:hypothetical protein
MMQTYYVTKGETNTKISLGNPYVLANIPFYRANFEFDLRRFYYISYSKTSKPYEEMESERNCGDIEIKIYTTTDLEKEYTYVDIANQTRELLLDNWKEKYGIEKKLDGDTAPAMNINVFLSAENRYSSLLSSLNIMTSYSQVKEICDTLIENGVTNINISLLGWQKAGYFSNISRPLIPEAKLGGKDDFIDLMDYAKSKGIQVSVETNTLQLYAKPKDTNLRKAAVKGPGVVYLQPRYPTNSGMYRYDTDFYVYSPKFLDKKDAINKNIDRYKKYEITGVNLNSLGNTLFTDYNKNNASLRQENLDLYVKWLAEYNENFPTVSVYGANEYAVANADRILEIPVDSSFSQLIDEKVPFIEIVYHGLVDYYTAPINKEDDADYSFLTAMEYGAFPTYELTYKPTDDLKYTYYNFLFSSEYTVWLDKVTAAYNGSMQFLEEVRSAYIINHYRVIDGAEIYCTEYSNGAKIYVNYDKDRDYDVDGIGVVGKFSYKVVEGR